MIKKTILLSLAFFYFQNVNAQDTLNFHISGALDMYYGREYDNISNERPDFLYNHHRVNELALNLGLIKFSVDNQHVRSNIGIMTGTYSERNLASEPAVFRNIYEANVGVALNKSSSLWLDAGIFPSHIGFESAISGDNMTMTRSLVAENTPYYLAGAKLNYAPNDKLNLGLTVCNGWQRIRKSEDKESNIPALGTQLSYNFSEKVSASWNTFWEYDHKITRSYHNLYTNIKASDKLKLIVGFDIGIEKEKNISSSDDRYFWFAPVAIAQYAWSPKLKTSFRYEYFRDYEFVITDNENINGFSFNLDYEPYPKALIRLEYRKLTTFDDLDAFQDRERNHLLQVGLFYQFKKDFR